MNHSKMAQFSRENPYNQPDMERPLSSQFCENGPLISHLTKAIYEKVKIQRRIQWPVLGLRKAKSCFCDADAKLPGGCDAEFILCDVVIVGVPECGSRVRPFLLMSSCSLDKVHGGRVLASPF